MIKKIIDLSDSDRRPIIICHIKQLWENVWYNTIVFNFFFLNILIIIFHFLNYQLSVLFLIFSHISHLLFFFLFHHALYISNSRNSHVIFLIFFFIFILSPFSNLLALLLFYFIYLYSNPSFFDSLNPSPSSPNIRSNAFPWYSPSTKLTFHLAQNQYDIFISLLPNTNSWIYPFYLRYGSYG